MCPGFWFGAYGLRIQGAAFAARGMSRRGQFAVEQGVQQPTIVTRAVTYDRLLSSMQSLGYTILSMCMKMYIHMHMLYIYIYIYTYIRIHINQGTVTYHWAGCGLKGRP